MTTTTDRTTATPATAPVRKRVVRERLAAVAVPVGVTAVRTVTPSVLRLTLAGEGLVDMPSLGDDQFFRLLLPRPDQDAPVLPTTERWWPEMQEMPVATRPVLRNYTVRAARPELGELDVDVVVHGDTGPASRWARRAAVGSRCGVIVQDTGFLPPEGTRHVLVVADATAVPAAAGIVAGLPEGVTATVLAECPTAEDVPEIPVRDGVRTSWHAEGTASLLELVRSTALEADGLYAWVAGEASMATSVRRHLVRHVGLGKDDVYFCGYWRADAPAYED